MFFLVELKKILFVLIRKLERYPEFILFILNNISHFNYFLPHDKDYYGMKLILDSGNQKNSFLDVGSNTGTSSLGFRKMGFTNKIHLFEPNYFLYTKFLKKIKKKYSKIETHNLALGSKNSKINFYMPYVNNKFVHYFSSFDKNYVEHSCLNTFPNKKIVLKKIKIRVVKFDDLRIEDPINFIKIDTEGYDFEVIKGMKKTINRFKPVLLIEYNPDLFSHIVKFLKNYSQYFYSLEQNSLIKINNLNDKNFDRFGNSNSLSIRNIYFIYKKNK